MVSIKANIILGFMTIFLSEGKTIIENKEFAEQRGINDNILKILEDLRQRMHMDMTDSVGIPRLDPFELNRIEIKPDDTELGAEINATEIKAVGLNTFEAKKVNLNIITRAYEMHLYVPKITVTGKYEAFGNIGGLFNLYGKGDANILVWGLDLKVTGKFHILSGLSIECDVNVGFEKVDIDLSNLMGGGELNEFFNTMLSDMVPEIFDEYWPELKPDLDAMIAETGTNALSGLSFLDLLGIINGVKPIFPPIEPK